jgi:SSS family solute:Na+ symporter
VVRMGIIVGLVLAITIGYYARGGYFIARATSIFFGMCASTFLPAFIGALFFRRVTRSAVIASMAVGFLATAFWLVFVKAAEAGSIGLVRMFTPQTPPGSGIHPNSILWAHPNWPVVDPLLIALPLSALTLVVVSLFTRPPSRDHLARCFARRELAAHDRRRVEVTAQ